ncbi:MAG: hypothetical protein JXN60_07770 [Lentisphaerae bacterium]|nr:hypothetical protein [Lentisphaerota bacterium]
MRFMSKLKAIPLIFTACMLTAGCVKNTVLIKVRSDGSGTILVTRQFAKQIVPLLEKQMSQMKMYQQQAVGTASSIPDNIFFDEESLKNEAGNYGNGVTFDRAKPYDRDGAKGSVALYSFTDINNVHFGMKSMNPSDKAMIGTHAGKNFGKDADERSFGFKFSKGPINTLTINIPSYPTTQTAPISKPKPDSKAIDPQLAMMMMAAGYGPVTSREEAMQKLFQGMTMSFVIEVEGADVKTDATYAYKTNKGNQRIVLLEMNMDIIMATEKGRELMDPDAITGGGQSQAEIFSQLKDIPGMKLETKQKVVTTFK